MRFHRPGFEFRMELTSQKPGMTADFDDLHQFSVRRSSADDHSGFLQALQLVVVEFIAVAVPFGYFVFLIGLVGKSMVFNAAGVCAQSHRRTFIR